MKTRTQKAYEARRKVVASLDDLNDGIETRGEATAEDLEVRSRLEGELTKASEAMEAAMAADAEEKRYDEAFASSGFAPGEKRSEAPSQHEAEVAALQEFAAGERRHVDFMPTEFGRIETRAALDTNAARGGVTVPVSMYDSIIKSLREFSTIVQAGATVRNTASGEEITIPKRSTFPSASLLGEGSTYGKSDGTYTAVALNAYKYGFISQVSEELLSDSAFNMAAEVGEVGGEAIGLGTGVHFLNGTGSSQPQGLINATAGTAFASASAITADELIDITHSITRPYRNGAAFILADSTIQALRKLKDSEGNYLWRPGLTAGAEDTLLGYPVLSDPNMPEIGTGNKVVIFGNIGRGFTIRMAGGVRVERSDEYAWDSDLVSWKFSTRMDSVITDSNAVKTFAMA